LKDVYHNETLSIEYEIIATKIKSSIESKCVIDGPFGLQYIEGVNADGSVTLMAHDGEESDTTLIPVYGYERYDCEIYKNYTRFALSEYNIHYNPETKGIKWGNDATMTGYMTALANVTDEASMSSKTGYMTEIRKITDIDGSTWWWPYEIDGKYGDVCRIPEEWWRIYGISEDHADAYKSINAEYPGKCGWASGVFISLFIQEFLGIKYDAPKKTVSFRPFSPSSSFTWRQFRIGSGIFSASYIKTDDYTQVKLVNENSHNIKLILEIPDLKSNTFQSLTKNGTDYKNYSKGVFLSNPTYIVDDELSPFESVAYALM